jgi:hypothetical protein
MEILKFLFSEFLLSFSTIFGNLKKRSTGEGGGGGVVVAGKNVIIPGALARCAGGSPLSPAYKASVHGWYF